MPFSVKSRTSFCIFTFFTLSFSANCCFFSISTLSFSISNILNFLICLFFTVLHSFYSEILITCSNHWKSPSTKVFLSSFDICIRWTPVQYNFLRISFIHVFIRMVSSLVFIRITLFLRFSSLPGCILKPIIHLATLFARREAKTRIQHCDWLRFAANK